MEQLKEFSYSLRIARMSPAYPRMNLVPMPEPAVLTGAAGAGAISTCCTPYCAMRLWYLDFGLHIARGHSRRDQPVPALAAARRDIQFQESDLHATKFFDEPAKMLEHDADLVLPALGEFHHTRDSPPP